MDDVKEIETVTKGPIPVPKWAAREHDKHTLQKYYNYDPMTFLTLENHL